MEHLSSTHPVNQQIGYDRNAEIAHFVNHTTTRSKSEYSILNIGSIYWTMHAIQCYLCIYLITNSILLEHGE